MRTMSSGEPPRRKRLLGLRSRWTMPRSCTAAIAAAVPASPFRRSTREDGGEVLAVEPLHGEERLAVAGRAVAHVARDAWVVDLGEQAALAGEALRDARVAARLEDQLERDRLPRLAVDGAIDDAHA